MYQAYLVTIRPYASPVSVPKAGQRPRAGSSTCDCPVGLHGKIPVAR